MDVRYIPTPKQVSTMTTAELRQTFLVETLFAPGEIHLVYTHADRIIVGGVMPREQPIRLETATELKAAYFAERREIGVLNFGGSGEIAVDGTDYRLAKYDMLYIGRGSQHIEFCGMSEDDYPRFLLVSLPAHTAYPTTLVKEADARQVSIGTPDRANERTIYQYIHMGGVQSCQLVMGLTKLKSGSIWNTMPPHTHDRRSEVYMYFDLADGQVVFHMMGQPQETRHLIMRDGDVAISPAWSIHSGAGTSSYTFLWAMGGENQEYTDMDALTLNDIS